LALYLTAFRTHVWDEHVAKVAGLARASSRSGAFVVTADETRGPLDVAPFFKLPHTDDFTSLSLPNTPEGRSLWWNADYMLYLLRQRYPGFDYYILIEYDAFVNCDFDAIIAECAARRIDMAMHALQRIWQGSHWAYPSVHEISEDGKAWQALIPVVIISGKAIDALYNYRLELAERLAQKTLKEWPYCEAVLPTAAFRIGLKVEEFSQFVDTSLLRFRPFLSLNDARLRKDQLFAHPVMGGRRYVKAFIDSIPKGAHLMTDGYLCPELEPEDPADLAAVLGADCPKRPAVSQETQPALTDWAANKPATQSSLSRWSNGKSLEIDAGKANAEPLPDDYAFHTEKEENPWWTVDLLEPRQISGVEILNRRTIDRFLQFSIETSMDDADWQIRVSKQDEARVSSDPARPAMFAFAEPVRARYVRIRLNQNDYLHLRRVRVLGR